MTTFTLNGCDRSTGQSVQTLMQAAVDGIIGERGDVERLLRQLAETGDGEPLARYAAVQFLLRACGILLCLICNAHGC